MNIPPTTPASGMVFVPQGSTPRTVTPSYEERLERWFYKPLEDMETNPDLSFALISLLLPLIERYLRYKTGMADSEKFSQGHRSWSVLSPILGCTDDQAYAVWQCLRNGLLHRAAIKQTTAFSCALHRDTAGCVEVVGSHLKVNPYLIRDALIPKFRDDVEMWLDADYALMEEYVVETP